VSSRLVARAKLTLAKRQAETVFDKWKESGPHAELHTQYLYGQSELIEVARILDDKTFTNFRTSVDPTKLAELQTSIDLEGLRTPITVVESLPPGHYYVRAGFRRTQAVRNLGWEKIPAVVLPADTPRSEEYWTNILENTNREKLSPYEIACAAKMMRDRFGVAAATFAAKSGHSEGYVSKLLTCIDRLPAEVLHSWRRGDRVPFEIYFKLSCMTPLEAVKNLRLWMGQHRIAPAEVLAEDALRKLRARKTYPDKLLTVRGIERTQRLIMAIRVSKLPQDKKDLCQQVVEYCQGGRKRIDGLVCDRENVPNRELAMPVFDDLRLASDSLLPPPESDEMEEQRRKMEQSFRELRESSGLPNQDD